MWNSLLARKVKVDCGGHKPKSQTAEKTIRAEPLSSIEPLPIEKCVMTLTLGSMRNRAVLSFCDQIVASAGNVTLTVFVARTTSTTGFGSYSIALSLVFILVSVARATSTDPLLVKTSGKQGESTVQNCRDAISGNIFIGVLIGVTVAAVTLLVNVGPAREVLLAFAVVATLISLQEATRYVAITARGPGLALLNDLLWSVTGVAAFVLLNKLQCDAPWQYLAAWGVTSLLGAAVTFLALPEMRHIRLSPSWLSEQRSLGYPFLLQSIAETGTLQIALLLVAAVAGLSAIAGIRVAITLFGPVTVIFGGVQLLLLPEFASRGHIRNERVFGFSRNVSIGLAIMTGLYALVLTTVPESLGRAAFGPAWDASTGAIGPYALAVACTGLMTAPSCAMRARGYARQALRVALTQSPIVLVAPVVGAFLDGGTGAVWGIALSALVSATLWWITMLRYHGGVLKSPTADPPMPAPN